MRNLKKSILYHLIILISHLITYPFSLAMDEGEHLSETSTHKRLRTPAHGIEDRETSTTWDPGEGLFKNLDRIPPDILLHIFSTKNISKPSSEVCWVWRKTLLTLPIKYKAALKNESHLNQYFESDFKLDDVHINFKITKEIFDNFIRHQPYVKGLNLNPTKKEYSSQAAAFSNIFCRNFYIDINYFSNHLTDLENLNLSHNVFTDDVFKFADISPLTKLKNLRDLKLGNTELRNINVFENFTNLTELDISHNKFFISFSSKNPRINGDFRQLTNLTILNLAHSEFPAEIIGDLTNLRNLNLSGVYSSEGQLSYLSALLNLSNLNLSHTHNINDVPFLTNLQKLEKLNLRKSRICHCRSLVLLTSLKKLDLEQTGLEDYDIKKLKEKNPNPEISYSYENLYADPNIDLEGKFGEDFYDF